MVNLQTYGLTTALGMRRLDSSGGGGVQYQALIASGQTTSGPSQAEVLQAVELAEALGSLGNSSKALTDYLLHFSAAQAQDQAAKM